MVQVLTEDHTKNNKTAKKWTCHSNPNRYTTSWLTTKTSIYRLLTRVWVSNSWRYQISSNTGRWLLVVTRMRSTWYWGAPKINVKICASFSSRSWHQSISLTNYHGRSLIELASRHWTLMRLPRPMEESFVRDLLRQFPYKKYTPSSIIRSGPSCIDKFMTFLLP